MRLERHERGPRDPPSTQESIHEVAARTHNDQKETPKGPAKCPGVRAKVPRSKERVNPFKCLRALVRRPTKRSQRSSGQARVTRQERVLMARLREEGLTLDEVARRVGRTRKTVRRALRPGDQAVPEPHDDEEPELPTPSERSTGGRERPLTPVERRERLLDGLEPRLIAAADELFDAKPEIAEDLIRKTMHMPERTFDMILEEVAISQLESSPEDRRRVAEAYLRRYEGRTRSEMDVVLASFEIFGTLLDRVQADAWPRAIGGVLGNGEVHKIVEALDL